MSIVWIAALLMGFSILVGLVPPYKGSGPGGKISFDFLRGLLIAFVAGGHVANFLSFAFKIRIAMPPAELAWAGLASALLLRIYLPWNISNVSSHSVVPSKGLVMCLGAAIVLTPIATVTGVLLCTIVYWSSHSAILARLVAIGAILLTHALVYSETLSLFLAAFVALILLIQLEPDIDLLLKQREDGA